MAGVGVKLWAGRKVTNMDGSNHSLGVGSEAPRDAERGVLVADRAYFQRSGSGPQDSSKPTTDDRRSSGLPTAESVVKPFGPIARPKKGESAKADALINGAECLQLAGGCL